MKRTSSIVKLILAALVSQAVAAAALAEPAGVVLLAAGENSAVRGGKSVKLSVGSAVESGDRLVVGAGSNLQVRFTDKSIVALKPGTELSVDKYQFADKPETDNTALSLFKGGLRTITGLIGHRKPDNYAVKTETATIGIRGTHYTLVSCNNDCRGNNGALAPNGTYGSVTEGAIAVKNQAGETQFGRDSSFHVASASVAPERLLTPPNFLRDKLEGQAKAKDKDKPKEDAATKTAGTGAADSATGTSGATSSTGSGTETAATLTAAPSTVTTPSVTIVPNLANVVAPGLIVKPELPQAPPAKLKQEDNPTVVKLKETPACADYPCTLFSNAVRATASAGSSDSFGYADGGQTLVTYLNAAAYSYEVGSSPRTQGQCEQGGHTGCTFTQTADGVTYSYTDKDGGSHSGTISKEADAGSNSAGNMKWARLSASWSDNTPAHTINIGGSTMPIPASTASGVYHEHNLTGDAFPAALPTFGIYTYGYVGGTNPTDSAGHVGRVDQGGSWVVNLNNTTLATGQNVKWTVDGVSYDLGLAATPFAVTRNSESSGGVLTQTTSITGAFAPTVTCRAGVDCVVTNSFLGFTVFGANAEGLGVSYGANATLSGSATTASGATKQSTAFVGAYANPAVDTHSAPTRSGVGAWARANTVSGTSIASATSMDTSLWGYRNSTLTSNESASIPSPFNNDDQVVGRPLREDDNSLAILGADGAVASRLSLVSATTMVDAASSERGAPSADAGYVGNLVWTRYNVTQTLNYGGGVSVVSTGQQHQITGDPVAVLPTSGTFTYAHIGGTAPTDQAGHVGTLTNGGSWAVNFNNQTLGTASNVAWNQGENSYSLAVPMSSFAAAAAAAPSGMTAVDGSFSASGVRLPALAATVTCTGTCGGVGGRAAGSATPNFFGGNAQSLGVAYTTQITNAAGKTVQTTASVQAYKR